MTKLLFDYDPILYSAGSVGEKRTIKVVHDLSGDEYEFKTRTEFYGGWSKKDGGWLAEYNTGKDSPRIASEFTITDIQTPEPLENCLFTMKSIISNTCNLLGVDSYYGYSGRGKVFREDLSTLLKYKGNRENMLRPIHLDALKDYIEKHHACEVVTGIEADDAVSIDSVAAWKKWKKSGNDDDKVIMYAVDKDAAGVTGHWYNPNTPGHVCSHDGFGWLTIGEKRKVKGRGRLWLYYQTMSQDTSDNYKANCFSDKKWGEMAAYNCLSHCKNDFEAWEALAGGFITLYPEPKVVTGWRGDEIEIDWKYVLNECFNLAKMLRTRDEKPTDVEEVLKNMGVDY